MMHGIKALAIPILLIACLNLAVYAASNIYISNVGVIKTVNVRAYEDPSCSVELTKIDWGIVEPSSVTNKTVYIRNEANVPVILILTTQDWNPSNASNWIQLTWNYNGSQIAVNDVTKVVFSLAVAPDITGIQAFSFTIIITGEG